MKETFYIIEDDFHCEFQGRFDTYEEALGELRRRSKIPWDKEPNLAPCGSWRTCGRSYFIEKITREKNSGLYDDRILLDRLEVSKKEVRWKKTSIVNKLRLNFGQRF